MGILLTVCYTTSNMAQTDQPQFGGVVTGNGAGVWHGRRLALLIVGGLAILILCVAGGWLLASHLTLLKKTTTTNSPVDYSKLTPTAALSQAKQELKEATTTQDRAQAYEHLGSAYANNNQPQQAIDSYKTAVSELSQATGSTTSGDGKASADVLQAGALAELANEYILTNQIPQAIDAYNQIIVIYQHSSDPEAKDLVTRYQNLVNGWEGKGN